MEQMMPGTLSPEQMRMQAMIQALRQPAQAAAPVQQQQANQVVSAGAFSDGMDTSAIGGALGNMGRNVGTAYQYGTNPFSQQTNMLAAQDAAFR